MGNYAKGHGANEFWPCAALVRLRRTPPHL